MHADFGGFYNANVAQLILAEVSREHGQGSLDQLDLERIFGFKPGSVFDGSFKG